MFTYIWIKETNQPYKIGNQWKNSKGSTTSTPSCLEQKVAVKIRSAHARMAPEDEDSFPGNPQWPSHSVSHGLGTKRR